VTIEVAGAQAHPIAAAGAAAPELKVGWLQYSIGELRVAALSDNTGAFDETGNSCGGIPASESEGGIVLCPCWLQLDLAEHEDSKRRCAKA
jgi:hypothetical protein